MSAPDTDHVVNHVGVLVGVWSLPLLGAGTDERLYFCAGPHPSSPIEVPELRFNDRPFGAGI